MKHVLSISGGKDSTAMYLLALEQGYDFIAVFADTGNEHEITYEYVATLHERTGGPRVHVVRADFGDRIRRRRLSVARDQRVGRKNGLKLRYSNKKKRRILSHLKPSGNPFLDLCLLKGRFPSTVARFCSQELKHLVIYSEIHEPLLDDGCSLTSWQGVRAEESRSRACLPMREPDPNVPEIRIYRPLIGWSVDDVFDIHRRHGIDPNPLYKLGFSRVGCMPCIHSRKDEIRNIAQRFPEHIAKVARWEKMVSLVSKRGVSTLFSADKTPGTGETRSNIANVVKWSRTVNGGRQYALPQPVRQCSSVYGLCE